MGTLQDTLQDDLKSAMKERDKLKLGVLRMTIADVKNEAVAKGLGPQGELDDDVVLGLIASGVKRRKDSATQYRDAERVDLAETEEAEIVILEQYLPEQLSDEDLQKIVDEVIAAEGATEMKDMGGVMKAVMAKVGKSAEGQRVSAAVKAGLQ